ncbi:sulfate reduction electron transfer complex DsrMKJOP subunit DsrP [Tenacibaculum finnmarkense]|uniref:sulfate reduction electron transfer complex DsrMKJOP subunit DsrP n=1 Tax=Tenacibaculum finnmarkense TaxID=2781243 RepID=UPI001E41B000|nr:NrfD/PsrC family molybdoenzyme membrane anchor subunit [Tenacibaculum finnmarkense]MCD8412938.1 polysulfide reductase NrfD [Tenacibaculum finnmarkense genomovar ulcerans]MCG8206973.1 polysulfide reductase NrfD [Tenacibaculum finnmarkense genomovar finnmarkense]MCG8723174.1 polysulfide reductase NrfD [Tenacibaculum finnmarkense]MCG8741439.1 polysulfide reductase NrfD [Tenacibaculum finnmarkense]MCG8764784.1 polysulfide reductase NrfD [Tenacibaculum finnmarkense]
MRRLKVFTSLIKDSLDIITHGSKKYHLWMAFLTLIMLIGMYCYSIQLEHGLSVTGMTDRVSWGLYISNFTFLVGVAAAAVMLVMPTYVLKDVDFKQAVLIGEGLAVAALIMCLAFVVADMGGPAVLWHMMPIIGVFNFPNSMLTWDVIALNGYLFINISIPFYILFRHYQGKESKKSVYLPGAIISVFWAVGIHLVTAFLYQGLQAKPFWNTALLGPRFLASAFAAGPALIILVLAIIRTYTEFKIENKTIKKLALVVTVTAQINLIMLVSELFKEFYAPTHHSESAYYLFFGLDGKTALLPWIWTAITLNVIATITLTFHKLRNNFKILFSACVMLFIAIWIEKGFGLIVPGFIPGPYGKIAEYTPTGIEIGVTVGIWAMGALIFTILARTAIEIELGKMRYKK